jgi:hypothetical protein
MPRPPEIAFRCASCQGEAVAGLDGGGACRSCRAQTRLEVPASWSEPGRPMVERCPACGSALLYVQRDFNQRAGLAVVVVGALLAPFTPFYASLVVAVLIDAALYLLLPEITVCYRCHAHFRRFRRNPAHGPFDLHLAEQYEVHRPPEG